MSKSTTGSIVRQARQARNLSREALAQRANISVSTVVRIENHDSLPAFRTMVRIATELELPLAELTGEQPTEVTS